MSFVCKLWVIELSKFSWVISNDTPGCNLSGCFFKNKRGKITPREIEEWTRQDLNLRPPGYQPGAPTNLSYPSKGEPRHRGVELNGSDSESHSSSSKSSSFISPEFNFRYDGSPINLSNVRERMSSSNRGLVRARN